MCPSSAEPTKNHCISSNCTPRRSSPTRKARGSNPPGRTISLWQKKMSQAFSLLYRRKLAVLQCCQTILGRFPQLDAHFPCRFLEFGRRRGNFFEKNRINPAVFRMFQFPRSQFPIGCGVFPFFAVAGKMGTARTFIPFPIMRMWGGFSNRTSSMQRLQIFDTRAAVSYNTHNP